jgi:putative flavoprotein involved in K+ transport
MRATLDAIDEHIADVHPEWPHAVEPAAEALIQSPPTAVDLATRRIGTVLWATGYRRDYGWLDVPHAVDRSGEIVQRYGVSPVPGLYTIGLNFQRYRASHFIGGVGADALLLARELGTTQRSRVRLQPRGFALAGI